jgi:hypothetical protein
LNNIRRETSRHFNNKKREYLKEKINEVGSHTAEPLVPEPSPFEVETAIAKLKKYKYPGSDQIPAELIQAGETLRSEIQKLINSIWSKEELPDQ